MNLPKTKPNHKTSRKGGGFSAIELIITVSVITIVTGFGVLGITRAKASMRLAGAAREYASYVEKARVLSIRSHADDASERSTIAVNENKTSYDITMDLDNDGDLDTRTITLPGGVEFDGDPETIAFDWRGRTWNTKNGVPLPNEQVSIRLKYGTDIASIDITGSGDITINSAVFDDDVPNVTLNVGDLASNGTRTTTTVMPTSPTEESPVITTPPVTTDPGSEPDPVDTGSDPNPTTEPNPTTNPTPTPTPTPTPSPSPSPTTQQPPAVCTLNVDRATLSLSLQGSSTIKVSHNASVSLAITAISSKASDLQVSGGAQTLAPGEQATFTIKSKKLLGSYTVTFRTSCGEKVVPVTVVSVLTLGL
jgi:type II secretory pathway pseudopilin PulG